MAWTDGEVVGAGATYNEVGELELLGVEGLEVIEESFRTPEAGLWRLGHDAELGVNVRLFLRIRHVVPGERQGCKRLAAALIHHAGHIPGLARLDHLAGVLAFRRQGCRKSRHGSEKEHQKGFDGRHDAAQTVTGRRQTKDQAS
jgi:hypothetical protein